MNRDAALPTRWAEGSFTDALEIIRGISFPTDAKSFAPAPGLIACLRTTNVQRSVEWEDLWYVPEKYIRNPRQFVEPEDILISTANSLELVGKVAQISDVRTKATIGTFIMLLRPNRNLNPRFIFHQLSSAEFQEKIRATASTTTNISNVSGQKLTSLSILIASRREQDRIVEEIEKQFTRLDAAVAALKRIQANLKRYRAAVLKAACEGRLVPTEAELARREGRSYEPASVLLERILAERPSHWEVNAPSTSLPIGWAWTAIGQVAECLDGKRVPVNKEERKKCGGTIPYYGANGQVGWIDGYLFDEPLVLVVEDETFVGRTLPFSYLIRGKSWVNNHAHVLRSTDAVLPDYLNYSLAFYPFTPLTTGSTGRRKLTQKALMSAPYALPPLAEQQRIVAEIDRRFSTLDHLESSMEFAFTRASVLRQSILKSAFQGKLVPQDPNDEPASVLLERIRAERAGSSRNSPLKQRALRLKENQCEDSSPRRSLS